MYLFVDLGVLGKTDRIVMQNSVDKQVTRTPIGFRAFLLMILFSVFYLYRVNVSNVHLTLFRIALLITFILTVTGVLFGRIKIYRTYLFLYVFIFADLALSAFDIIRSQSNPLIVKVILGHIVALGVLWVSVMQLNTEIRIVKAVKWYVYASIIAAGITIYTLGTGNMPFPQFVPNLVGTDLSLTSMPAKFLGIIPRATAAFYDPTFYGLFLCICLCFAVFYRQWIAKSALMNILIIVDLIMLVATLSRTAWIGIVVLAVFVYVYIFRARLRVVAAGLLLIVIVLGITLSIGISGSQNFDKVSEVGSLQSFVSREMYWNAGLSEFISRPLFGGGSKRLGEAVGGTPSAHIVYLSWLAKYGIIGFLIYGAFFFYPIVYVLFKRSLSVRYRFLILGVMCPMAVMYLGYDFFNDLDIEYLAFGIVYAIVLNRIGCKQNLLPVSTVV